MTTAVTSATTTTVTTTVATTSTPTTTTASTSSTTGIQHAQPYLANIRLPPFDSTHAHSWARQVEAILSASGLYTPAQRFSAVLSALPPSIVTTIQDVINPIGPITDYHYRTLLEALTSRFTLPDRERLRAIIAGKPLGNKRPTHYLRELRAECHGELANIDPYIFRDLFLRALPHAAQQLLTTTYPHASIDELAEAAERYLSTSAPAHAINYMQPAQQPTTLSHTMSYNTPVPSHPPQPYTNDPGNQGTFLHTQQNQASGYTTPYIQQTISELPQSNHQAEAKPELAYTPTCHQHEEQQQFTPSLYALKNSNYQPNNFQQSSNIHTGNNNNFVREVNEALKEQRAAIDQLENLVRDVTITLKEVGQPNYPMSAPYPTNPGNDHNYPRRNNWQEPNYRRRDSSIPRYYNNNNYRDNGPQHSSFSPRYTNPNPRYRERSRDRGHNQPQTPYNNHNNDRSRPLLCTPPSARRWSNTQTPPADSQLCFYHYNFGEAARKCEAPCRHYKRPPAQINSLGQQHNNQ